MVGSGGFSTAFGLGNISTTVKQLLQRLMNLKLLLKWSIFDSLALPITTIISLICVERFWHLAIPALDVSYYQYD
jgi:hypothetical protein